MTTEAVRRRKGEGSVARFHRTSSGCPEKGPDGERPDHKCRAPYRAQVWVRATNGKRVRKAVYGTTEKEVLAKVRKLTVAEGTGQVVADSVTVAQWMSTDTEAPGQWWEEASRDLKVNTRKGYRSKIEQYVIPHLGQVRLDRLTPDRVAKFYQDLRDQGLAEGSVRGVHAVLRRALTVAERRGKLAVNPCTRIDPPKSGTAKKRRPLTVEEAWKVLRLAGDNPRYWLALLQGLRQGEALALRWTDIHLDQDVPFLVVSRALSFDEDGRPVFDTPKSEASTDRVVPLVPHVVARLRLARTLHLEAGGSPEDLVFHNSVGNPMDPRRDYLGWVTLLDVAGVPHTPLHAARNTTAALLENAGVPDRVVAAILGHSTVQMTHHYQRDNLLAVQEGMKALGSYLDTTRPEDDVA